MIKGNQHTYTKRKINLHVVDDLLAKQDVPAPCGCVQIAGEIDFCPLHKAAPLMLKVLKEYIRVMSNPHTTAAMPHTTAQALKAIRMAEGKR